MSRSRYFDLAIVFPRDHAGAKKWKSELAANNSDQTTMVDKLLLDGRARHHGRQMRRAILFGFVLMLGRHVARAQGTILEDALPKVRAPTVE